jgi:hypothetical protein
MTIRQLNASHSKTEDRLLLRLTTREDEEFRLWLTRRLTQELLAHLRALLHPPPDSNPDTGRTPPTGATASEQPGAVAANGAAPPQPPAAAAADQHSAFTQNFQPGRNLPLGAEPVLVVGYQLKAHQARYDLHLQLPTSQVLDLRLNDTLVRQILLLLENMQHKALWTTATPPGVPDTPTTHPALELALLPAPSTLLH